MDFVDIRAASLQDALRGQNVQLVRSHGPRTVAEIMADANRQMDLDDEMARLRGEWITPISPPKRPGLIAAIRRAFGRE